MRTMNIMKFLGFTNRLIRKLLAVYKLVKSLQPAFILQGGGRKSKGKTGGGGGGQLRMGHCRTPQYLWASSGGGFKTPQSLNFKWFWLDVQNLPYTET